MNQLVGIWIVTFTSYCAIAAQLDLSLSKAEEAALQYSYLLRAAKNDVTAASKQEDAATMALYPRLTLQGSYSYVLTLPEMSFGAPNSPPVIFGDHNNYSIGPSLRYTLWDNFASINNVHSLKKMKQSSEEIALSTKLQVLQAVRSAYIKVQLALEELNLFHSFLELANKQKADVDIRVREGAATAVDGVSANRQILGRRLQFQQAQSSLAAALKDLVALVGTDVELDLSRPGSKNMKDVTLQVNLDSLSKSVETLSRIQVSKPPSEHPLLLSQELVAKATDLAAQAQKANLFPRLDMQISATIAYPNGPQLIHHFQNSIGLSLTVPLYVGDPTWHLVEQKQAQARSVRFRAMQMRSDLQRDHDKAQTMINSLREQKITAQKDREEAKELARLYYEMYNEGKVRLLDVHTASSEALSAAINASRFDAHILQQIVALMAISGKDFLHE